MIEFRPNIRWRDPTHTMSICTKTTTIASMLREAVIDVASAALVDQLLAGGLAKQQGTVSDSSRISVHDISPSSVRNKSVVRSLPISISQSSPEGTSMILTELCSKQNSYSWRMTSVLAASTWTDVYSI